MTNFQPQKVSTEPHSNKPPTVTGPARTIIIALQKSIYWLTNHWLFVANSLAGVILGLGVLAPIFMATGFDEAGQAVYRFLAPHNHQLPQRSYFLFGDSGVVQTYTTEQIVGWGGDPQNLQAFVGNREIGFKTALNHRMMAIFVAIFFGGLWWAFAPRRPRVDLVVLLLTTLPLLIDGFSHVISEQSGAGFRATNGWAALITGHMFSDTFYSGTTFGTLNWLLRTITGLIFGLGLVWFLYPFLAHRFKAVRAQLEPKLRRIGAI